MGETYGRQELITALIKNLKNTNDSELDLSNVCSNSDLADLCGLVTDTLKILGYEGSLTTDEKLNIYDEVIGLYELRDAIGDEFNNEVWWANTLIYNKAYIPTNIFNTYDWANACLEQFKKPQTTFPYLSDIAPDMEEIKEAPKSYRESIFEDDWRGTETLENFMKLHETTHKNYNFLDGGSHHRENGVYLSPVEKLLADIRCGIIPEPELLIGLAKCFDLYFSSEGRLSLEDVFFGAIPKRRGNYAERSADSFNDIDHKVFEHSLSRKFISETQEEMALHFIKQHNLEYDKCLPTEYVEAFLRKHRRWRKRMGITSKI